MAINENAHHSESLLIHNEAQMDIDGGTWLMSVENGKLFGKQEGLLGDHEIGQIEEAVKYNQLKVAEQIHMRLTNAEPIGEIRKVFKWVGPCASTIKGVVYPLLACDSTQRRPAITAPLLEVKFRRHVENPLIKKLAGMGTDAGALATAEEDVFLYDAGGAPWGKAGASKSRFEQLTDAPAHFQNLFQSLHYAIPPGSYWHWFDDIYPGYDVVKIDPAETRMVDGAAVFFSPYGHKIPKEILKNIPSRPYQQVPDNHIIRRVDWLSLFKAKNSVITVDLSLENPPEEEVEKIINGKYLGVVIAGLGLGNVYNLIKRATIEAAKRGKLVITTSTCLIPGTSDRYEGVALLAANDELQGELILNGYKISKYSARALLIRALLEEHNQQGAQQLVDSYAAARSLIK